MTVYPFTVRILQLEENVKVTTTAISNLKKELSELKAAYMTRHGVPMETNPSPDTAAEERADIADRAIVGLIIAVAVLFIVVYAQVVVSVTSLQPFFKASEDLSSFDEL
jgi:hypothetical protein